jgi:DNA-binding MurR/RpiR family transcriptional regulator
VAETLAQLIADRLDSMTKSERRVARSLLANYPLLGLRTVAEFATEVGVSAPTVLRFVGRLDLDGYSEFQEHLRSELEDQIKAPLEKATGPRNGAASDMSVAMSLNLRSTLDGLVKADVDGIVEMIASSRRPVFLTGGRLTDSLAVYMATHLGLMRPGVHHVDRAPDRRRDCLLDMAKGSTVVTFDIRRYDTDLLQFTEAASARKAHVILFTDQWLSPVSRVASHVVTAYVDVPSIWDSNAALLATVELILARVAHRTWPETRERLSALEALRDSSG